MYFLSNCIFCYFISNRGIKLLCLGLHISESRRPKDCTIPHFKATFIRNDSHPIHKSLWATVLMLAPKMSVWIISIEKNSNLTEVEDLHTCTIPNFIQKLKRKRLILM